MILQRWLRGVNEYLYHYDADFCYLINLFNLGKQKKSLYFSRMRHILYLPLFFLLFSGCSISEEGVVEAVPLAPSELKATLVSGDQVDLSWKDNFTNNTGDKKV